LVAVFFKYLLVREIVYLVVVSGVHFVFHAVAIEVDPQKQNMTFGGFHVTSGKDGGSLLKAHVVAIVKVDG
jgi:hypothetical protein